MVMTYESWSLRRALRQIAALPKHLQLWLAWLLASTLVVPLFLLENGFFAAMMVCQGLNLIFGTILMLRFGMVRLLGLSHLLFWTPILLKFYWHYGTLENGPILAFAWVMIATIAVSLILDGRDLRDWLRGSRSPVGQV